MYLIRFISSLVMIYEFRLMAKINKHFIQEGNNDFMDNISLIVV